MDSAAVEDSSSDEGEEDDEDAEDIQEEEKEVTQEPSEEPVIVVEEKKDEVEDVKTEEAHVSEKDDIKSVEPAESVEETVPAATIVKENENTPAHVSFVDPDSEDTIEGTNIEVPDINDIIAQDSDDETAAVEVSSTADIIAPVVMSTSTSKGDEPIVDNSLGVSSDSTVKAGEDDEFPTVQNEVTSKINVDTKNDNGNDTQHEILSNVNDSSIIDLDAIRI
ncbi:unnamed protein product [Ambrosiozyma monospora]|uniref:Unnamed protein product n=1 Tax=Ambrosiozyma monospora TaxID=43982 RepID=A0ACB5U446_AMBMO|nr:unnamed protein product [Ambrosiozyma monospora]